MLTMHSYRFADIENVQKLNQSSSVLVFHCLPQSSAVLLAGRSVPPSWLAPLSFQVFKSCRQSFVSFLSSLAFDRMRFFEISQSWYIHP